MPTITQTPEFRDWLNRLGDLYAKAKILVRIRRAEGGNFGDARPLGEGLSELRIDVGPGYRLYYGREGPMAYLLIIGGDKSTQPSDIAKARALWGRIKEEAKWAAMASRALTRRSI